MMVGTLGEGATSLEAEVAGRAIIKGASDEAAKQLAERENASVGGVSLDDKDDVLASVLSVAFPGILVYIVLWFVMPESNT